jgi:hypothetical protein
MRVHETRLTFLPVIVAIPSHFGTFDSFNSFNIISLRHFRLPFNLVLKIQPLTILEVWRGFCLYHMCKGEGSSKNLFSPFASM